MLESRKNPKPEKCLSKPQNPTNPLHAVLGKPDERKTRRLKKDHIANLINFYAQCLDRLDNRSIFGNDISINLTTAQSAY